MGTHLTRDAIHLPIDLSLPRTTRVFLVSDVHLGDGSAGDLFGKKDELFLACLKSQVPHADVVVVNGDAIDSMQAGALQKIERAHGRVLDAMRALAKERPVLYVLGNHENAAELRREFPEFSFVRGLMHGETVCIAHGHQFDLHWKDEVPRGHTLARLHSLLETVFQSPIRQPFRDYVNLPNRVVHRLWFFWTQSLRRYGVLKRTLGDASAFEHWRRVDNFWARGQWGDLGCLFQTAEHFLRETAPFETLVLGHSHQPGVVQLNSAHEPRQYVNAGSWSLDSANHVWIDRDGVRVVDALTGKRVGDERYHRLLSGDELPDMAGWFARYYKGFFRYDLHAIERDYPRLDQTGSSM